MTKEEILNGMSEEEFYSLYPTKEAWEAAQQQMAYGGMPDIMGVPFGAGIMLANGGTPYYGGPIYPAQYGTSVFTEKKMTPQQWEKYNIERGYQKVPAGKAQSNKPGAYSEFYNPKEYTMGEEAWGHGPAQSFKKVGAPADYDYNKDPNYKPIVQYGYKDPIVSKPVMPWSPAGTVAGSKEGLFYKNQNPALGKFVFREGKYTQYMDDQVAAATPVTPSPAAPVINKYGGAPCYECGGLHMEEGGGLSRGEDYGSKKKPYPSVKASDFAGGGRSYPIPTRADAVDALRLAGLHGRSDVKAKVYAKYPDLKKQVGGSMTPDLEGQYPIFGYGGYDSPFNYGQFPAMSHGGDLTSQGGNQDFLNERTSTYMNYIKNNVLKNMHEEESQKVYDAFMQMENQYMQMGGNSFNAMNPQNAALQNMYGQQMQQYRNQAAQDQANFREANMNLLGSIYGMPMAQEGKSTGSSASDILHQFAEEFGPRSRRTGLPLFPANIGTYYQMNKKDAASLAGLPQGFQMQGVKMTPQWGLGARTAMNIGNMFRGKSSKKVVPGFAPKAITFEFSGKVPPRGMFEDLKEPLKFDQEPEQQERKRWFNKKAKATPAPESDYTGVLDDVQHGELFPQGVYAPGRSPQDFMSSNLYKQTMPASIGPVDNRSTAWEDMMSKKNTAMAPYSEQFKAYGGLFQAQKGKSTPISMDEWKESLRFKAPTVDDSEDVQVPSMDTSPIKEQTEEEAFADVAGIQKRRQEQRDMFGAPMGDQPDLLTPEKDVNAKATLKRKRSGIGQAIGQYAVPAINKISSILEQKDYNKAKKKLEESMLADNTFMTSPMNAKNRGDYDVNSGMFRPDQMVPVQFPGYAQWGGFNTMQKGGTSKKDNRQVIPQNSWDQFKYGIKSGINTWKDVLPDQHSWDQFKQGFMSAFPNDGLDQLKQGFKQGIQSWIPDQNTIDKFNQAFPSNNPRSFIYKEEGGDISEGEELDLTPEEIDELRQQGYEIEYLD